MSRTFSRTSSVLLCVAAFQVIAQVPAANNDSGIVMDKKHGLMWQRSPVRNVDHKSATAYCKNLELSGSKDWRLPTKDELVVGFNVLPTEPGYNEGQTFLLWSSTETRSCCANIVFRNSVTESGVLEREKTWKPGGATLGARCVRDTK